MARAVNNLAGIRFGKLVAIQLLAKYNHNRTRMWLCKCDCGREVERASTKLSNKEIRSCGCAEHIRQARTAAGDSGKNSLYSSYRSGAKRRRIDFDITKEDFLRLSRQNCSYCGIEPQQIHYGSRNSKKGFGAYLHNGLDRVNNSLGYTLQNCVTCCKICNIAKSTMTANEFISWITRIVKYFNLT